MYAQFVDFLHEAGIDQKDRASLPAWRKCAHFGLLLVNSFNRNRCPVRASALAYTTLLAMVPLLAVALSVSTSMLIKNDGAPVEQLVDQLLRNVAPQLNLAVKGNDAQAVAKRQELVNNITGFIANIRTGALGTTGMVGLVLVAIMLLSNIEQTFNDIWGVERGRSWFLRVVNYWAAITLGPVLLVVVVGLTTVRNFEAAQDFLAGVPFLGLVFLYLAPFVVPIVGFTVFYKLIPNTRVEWAAALAGGICGGVLWQLNNLFNVIYVSRVVTYSKIYGSLGILPVFLLGLYFSWLILLLGAQICYAFQNRKLYFQEKQADGVNQRGREFIACRVMVLLAQCFQRGNAPTAVEISDALGVPSRLVTEVLTLLANAHLVRESTEEDVTFSPARPLEAITLDQILFAMRAGSGQELATRADASRSVVLNEFEKAESASRLAAAVTLKELVGRLG